MIKKISLFLSVVILFSIFPVSCDKRSNNNEDKSLVPVESNETGVEYNLTPDSKEIIIWVNDISGWEVNGFVKKYPDYTVDNLNVSPSEHAGNLQRLYSAIGSGTQPDLFLGYVTPIEGYYSNLFMPIHDYLTHDPEFNFETVEENLIKGGTFNNVVYFLPLVMDTDMLVWNMDLFENRGLDPDKIPETWPEFIEYNKKLLSYTSDGKIQTIGCNSLNWATLHVIATGQHYTDETGLTFNINTPSYKRTLEFVKSAADIYGGNNNLPQGIDFFLGNVGMRQTETGSTLSLPHYINGNFDFNIGKVPKPDDVEEDFYPLYWDYILAIPRAAKNPKGGWLYLKYKNTDAAYARAVQHYESNPDVCIAYYITHIPTREKFYEEYKNILSEKSWKMTRIRDELIRKANVPMYHTVDHTKLTQYLIWQMDKVLNDDISPEEFLKNAQEYGETIIKEFKDQKIKEGWTFKEGRVGIPPIDE